MWAAKQTRPDIFVNVSTLTKQKCQYIDNIYKQRNTGSAYGANVED